MSNSKTILHFHTGRGGHFNNPGYKTFCGIETIDKHVDDLFPGFEYQNEAYSKIKGRENLEQLLFKAKDSGNAEIFESKTGIDLGEFGLVDLNGTFMISQAQLATGTGVIARDLQYNTDEFVTLSECDADDMRVVLRSNSWAREQVLQEWVEMQLEGAVDWTKFDDDRYDELIDAIENHVQIDVSEYYIQEEEEA